MARQLKVFAVSLLLACLFSYPAHAEWSVTDSSNLSMIRSYTSYLQTYLPSISSNTGSIKNSINSLLNQFTMVDGVTSLIRDIRNYLSISWSGGFANKVTSQLNSILEALGARSGSYLDDKQMYLAFDDRYYYNSNPLDKYKGMVYSEGSYVNFYSYPDYKPFYGYLPTGQYRIFVNVTSSVTPTFDFSGFSVGTLAGSGPYKGVYRYTGTFSVPSSGIDFSTPRIACTGASGFYGSAYLYKISDEATVNDMIGDDIISHGQQLDQVVDQMEDLENTAFDSLDTSIGSLDFSGSALGQVVSGFTFIRAVFSAVYSSSPYISVLINLSCMLGVLALFLRVQPRFSRWEREHRDRTS